MLKWRHLTPRFVGGGVYRVKPLVVCFVIGLGEAGSSSHPPAVMMPQATTQIMSS